ncbi:MAG: polysaccharide deacetylase family protein [Deltaproteobacteria bacterium]|nr:polysaccharide deacetylase family protein [Deltaproteobacteria bacterium]
MNLITLLTGLLAWCLLAGVQPLAGMEIVYRGDATTPAVALTFDDGPSPRYTPQILEVLSQHQAQATFFVLGRHAQRYPHLVRAIAAAGHEIGNHSYSHLRLAQESLKVCQEEVARTKTLLAGLGVPPSGLFRPPYSEVSPQLRQVAAAQGQRLILWSINSADYNGDSGPVIAERVLQHVGNGAIIIFHDNDEFDGADRQPTVAALRLFLPILRQREVAMLTVSGLLGRSGEGRRAHLLRSALQAPPPGGRHIP